jgi:hypothetical protein
VESALNEPKLLTNAHVEYQPPNHNLEHTLILPTNSTFCRSFLTLAPSRFPLVFAHASPRTSSCRSNVALLRVLPTAASRPALNATRVSFLTI